MSSKFVCYGLLLLLVLLISGDDVSGDDVSGDDVSGDDVIAPNDVTASLKIEWARVLKALGVAIAVTLVVTLIAPLPVYLGLWLCGVARRNSNGGNNRRYGDDQMTFCCLPRDCSESQWGQPILYLGFGCLIGIPAGILAGLYSWPHL